MILVIRKSKPFIIVIRKIPVVRRTEQLKYPPSFTSQIQCSVSQWPALQPAAGGDLTPTLADRTSLLFPQRL